MKRITEVRLMSALGGEADIALKMMAIVENKATARSYYEQVLNHGNMSQRKKANRLHDVIGGEEHPVALRDGRKNNLCLLPMQMRGPPANAK